MEVARYWRTAEQRYRLTGETDAKTGQAFFSQRERRTGAANSKPAQFSGRGEVYSFTTIHAPPEGFGGQGPYIVALIRLAEGPLVTAQMTDVDADDVRIGMSVEMVTRALREDGGDGQGIVVYGYKFRPIWSSTNTQPKAMSEVTVRPEKQAQATNGHVTVQELVLQPK